MTFAILGLLAAGVALIAAERLHERDSDARRARAAGRPLTRVEDITREAPRAAKRVHTHSPLTH